MLTGTYCTQAVRNRHTRDKQQVIPATCLMCGSDVEDLANLLLECPALHKVRSRHIGAIRDIVTTKAGGVEWLELYERKDRLLRLIVDCSALVDLQLDPRTCEEIETASRLLCYAIHCGRSQLVDVA
jgi:hypothetical protein